MALDELNKTELREYMWKSGYLHWKLWEQQLPIYDGVRNFHRTDVEELVILCARQFGKSHLGVLMAIEDCLRYPNKCILIMAPTLKQCTEIVAPRLRDVCSDAPPGLIQRSKSESKWYVGSSELVLGGFDQASSSQRGKTVQNIYIEEIVDSHPDDYIESMRSDLAPALTHSDKGKMIFLTTPPKIPDHPFIIETMTQASLKGALYTYTIKDNNKLSQEQYDACVRRSGGEHSVDFRREYMCEIVRDASVLVVPDFSKDRHVKDFTVPHKSFYQTTVDFGGVRDKTVAVLTSYDFLRNKMLVIDERVFSANTPTKFIVESLREMEGNHHIEKRYADSPGQLLIDLKAVHNYDVLIPPKDDWKANINHLAVAFCNDEIEIAKKCQFVIASCNSGMFNKQRTDFERTVALGHCDGIAALMYAYRTLYKSNPYPQQYVSRDSNFVFPSKSKEASIAETMNINSFRGFTPKKFGSFNK